ncbi:hypothetical protein ACFUJ0_07135 [Streptomyces sp. NPDC057242]|uniref:hypothetical protein n=1 Tax=unclassified Streptomyces TaxID=2593676 RepID=UPI0036287132
MDLQHKAGNHVNASWSMVRLRDLVYDMVGLLFTELSAHGGMAGDDNAGRAFAAVYKPAVKTVSSFQAGGDDRKLDEPAQRRSSWQTRVLDQDHPCLSGASRACLSVGD